MEGNEAELSNLPCLVPFPRSADRLKRCWALEYDDGRVLEYTGGVSAKDG
jgi:hypothetical protein